MKYSLDTNTCIRYINGRAPKLREKIPTVPARDIVVCSVVRSELAYGAAKSQTPERSAEKQQQFLEPYATLPFDNVAAGIFGQLRAYLEKQGTPIGPYDMQIAAIALAHDLILVTYNLNEFSRVPDLKIEDWEV